MGCLVSMPLHFGDTDMGRNKSKPGLIPFDAENPVCIENVGLQ